MKKRILRKIIVLGLCALMMDVYAIGNGFYLGLMMGPARNTASPMLAVKNPPPVVTTGTPSTTYPCTFNAGATSIQCTNYQTLVTPQSGQFGTRIFLGNQFNPYAAFEMGGFFFSTIKYNSSVPIYGGASQRVRGIDAVFKGTFAWRSIDVYGKAGIAATYITIGPTFNPVFVGSTYTKKPPIYNQNNAHFSASTTYKHKFSPTFSLGASYDIDQSWVVDGSYNALLVGDTIGRITYLAIGLSYHFTDKYCGQFLCDD